MSEIEKNSSIFQYKMSFFEKIIFEIDYWLVKWPQSKYFKVRNFLFRRYDLIQTGLNPCSWWDTDILILHGMMKLLVDYVEKEKCFDSIDWDNDEQHREVKEKIQKIYNWWKQYPQQEKEIDTVIHLWCVDRQYSDELEALEKKIEKEEQEMLHILIDIRKYLWT